jgi:endothelin-converting enzyme/putative endopeptidase
MHLEGPWLSTTGKKKGPKKWASAEAKAKAESMIRNVIAAYKVRVNNLTWMSATTKVKAIEKINKLIIKIGFQSK